MLALWKRPNQGPNQETAEAKGPLRSTGLAWGYCVLVYSWGIVFVILVEPWTGYEWENGSQCQFLLIFSVQESVSDLPCTLKSYCHVGLFPDCVSAEMFSPSFVHYSLLARMLHLCAFELLYASGTVCQTLDSSFSPSGNLSLPTVWGNLAVFQSAWKCGFAEWSVYTWIPEWVLK